MKKKQLSLGVRFLLAFISFLLGIALFASAVSTALIADVRALVEKDTLRQLFHQALSAPVAPHRTDAPYQAGGKIFATAGSHAQSFAAPRLDNADSGSGGLSDALVSFIYSELDKQSEGGLAISLEELNELFDQSTIKDYVADKTASMVSDYYLGEVTTTFESEEIGALLEENKELIEVLIGEPLPEELTQEIVAWVDNSDLVRQIEKEGLSGIVEELDAQMAGMTGDVSDMLSQTLPGVSVEIPTISEMIDALRDWTSMNNLLTGIGICAVLIGLILLVNIKQLPKGLRRCGYPLLWAGIMFIPCMVVYYTPELWEQKELALIRSVVLSTLPVNGIVFGLGVLFVITGIITGIVSSYKARKMVPVTVSAPPVVEQMSAVLIEEMPAESQEVFAEEASVEEAPVEEEPVPDAPVVDEPVVDEPTQEAEVEAPNKSYCPNCGSERGDSAKFCRQCGHNLQ